MPPNYNLKKKDTPNIYFTGNGLSSDQMAELMDLVEGWTSPSTSSPSPAPPRSLRWPSVSSGSPGGAVRPRGGGPAHLRHHRPPRGAEGLADQAGYETLRGA